MTNIFNRIQVLTYPDRPKTKEPEVAKKIDLIKTVMIDDTKPDDYEPSDSFADDLSDPVIQDVTEEPEILDEMLPFTIVEEMPIFNPQKNKDYKAGNADLFATLQKMVRYPIIAQESNIQGKVFVRFVVTKTGDIADIKIVRSVDPILDNEVLRVIRSLPKFKPGMQRKVPVPVYYTSFVNFKLN